jgi:hypothetical protein
MEGPTSKKMKEPPKRANHKGNVKFPNPRKPPPVMRSIINLFIIQWPIKTQLENTKQRNTDQ